MKNFKSIILLAALSVPGLYSCAKQEAAEQPAADITLSQPSVEFECVAGGETTIDVKTTAAWEVVGLTEGVTRWIKLDCTSGTGDATVKVSCVEATPYTTKRIAVIGFKAGEKVANLVVKQYPDPESTICLDVDDLKFGKELGDPKTVTVKTAKSWSVEGLEAVQDWISLSATSGTGETAVEVNTIAVNEEPETRTAELGFRIDRVNVAGLVISQPSIVEVSVDIENVELAYDAAATQVVNFRSNAKTKTWKVEGYTDEVRSWLDIDKTEGIGDAAITFKTVAQNDGPTHSAALQIKVDDIHFVEIAVKQRSTMEITATPRNLEFAADKGETKIVDITTSVSGASVDWYVTGYTPEVQAWLTLDKVSAKGNAAVSFTTKGENKTNADRVAILEFHLLDDICDTVKVIQPMVPLAIKTISWVGDTGKKVTTLEGPDGAAYKGFPYANSSSAASVTQILDGQGGAVLVKSSTYTEEKTYKVWTDKTKSEYNLLTMGGNTAQSSAMYYTPSNIYQIRMKYGYVVIPAIEGFRLTHVFAKFGNGADSNVFSICSDMSGKTPTTVEGISKKPVSKLTDADFELKETKPNTPYWMYIDGDRLITEFKFTLTEVRE